MLANSAATLPRGHFLIEPYLYDVSSSQADGYGSLTYILYGVSDRFTAGMVPVFGYTRVSGGSGSSGVGAGDVSLQMQYRLTQFPVESSLPTVSIQLQETLPTGRYERLGNRPADGQGGGAYVTTLALNTQTWFWLPNGRILRMRFNVSQSFAKTARVEGVSVYGTDQDFLGHARPGNALFVDAAWEYSLTRNWVLALDLTWRHTHGTRVSGDESSETQATPVQMDSGASTALGFAPAIEYNFSPSVGLLFGIRVITGGHNTERSVTPALALNIVR
ncbi:MAG: transporter [Rhodanobacteraceae bacterium]